jgi:hypothetical protein
MGTLLQKADNKLYVQRMIALMYQRADISDVTNREGLATAMGLVPNSLYHTLIMYFPSSDVLNSDFWSIVYTFLSLLVDLMIMTLFECSNLLFQVASAHLGDVLEKLQRILDSHKRNGFKRY